VAKPSIYVETSVISYLAAHSSRDLVVAAHQQITHEWWQTAFERFDLFVSQLVIREISKGDPAVAQRRLALSSNLAILTVTARAEELVKVYGQRLGLAANAHADLLHIATAVDAMTDYLVTWNCSHIANGQVVRRLMAVNNELGVSTPLITTPEALLDPGDQGAGNHDT